MPFVFAQEDFLVTQGIYLQNGEYIFEFESSLMDLGGYYNLWRL